MLAAHGRVEALPSAPGAAMSNDEPYTVELFVTDDEQRAVRKAIEVLTTSVWWGRPSDENVIMVQRLRELVARFPESKR